MNTICGTTTTNNNDVNENNWRAFQKFLKTITHKNTCTHAHMHTLGEYIIYQNTFHYFFLFYIQSSWWAIKSHIPLHNLNITKYFSAKRNVVLCLRLCIYWWLGLEFWLSWHWDCNNKQALCLSYIPTALPVSSCLKRKGYWY